MKDIESETSRGISWKPKSSHKLVNTIQSPKKGDNSSFLDSKLKNPPKILGKISIVKD